MTRRTYTKDWPESYYPSYGPNGVINTDENGLGMITRSNMHVEERYGLPVPWRANWDVFDECCCRVCCGCRPIEGEAKPWPDGVAPSILFKMTTEIEMYWSSDGQPHSCAGTEVKEYFEQEWLIERTSDILPCEWRRIVDIPVMDIDCCDGGSCGPFPLGARMIMVARWEDCVGDDPEWPHENHCCRFVFSIILWNHAAGEMPSNLGLWPYVLLIHFAPTGVEGVGDCTTSDNPTCFQMGEGMDCLEGALSLWYQGANVPYIAGWSCNVDLVEGPFWSCGLKFVDATIETIPPNPEV